MLHDEHVHAPTASVYHWREEANKMLTIQDMETKYADTLLYMTHFEYHV